MNQAIVNAVNEHIVEEKLYMVEKGWNATKNMLKAPCYNPDWLAAQCEVLYYMIISLNGETDEQVQRIKNIQREIERISEEKTDYPVR